MRKIHQILFWTQHFLLELNTDAINIVSLLSKMDYEPPKFNKQSL